MQPVSFAAEQNGMKYESHDRTGLHDDELMSIVRNPYIQYVSTPNLMYQKILRLSKASTSKTSDNISTTKTPTLHFYVSKKE
jgi:hypothetical protein